MDLNAEFDQVIQQMDWGEVIERVKAMVDDMVMGDTPYPSPLLPTPTLPAEMWFFSQRQSVDRQYFGFTPHGAAPYSSGHNVHAAPIIPLEIQSKTTVIQQTQVYRQKQYHNIPVTRLPETTRETMVPVGILNGEVVYGPPTVPPVPPPPVQGPRLSGGTMEKMVPIGELNGVKVYGLPEVPLVSPAAPPVTCSNLQTQKPMKQEDDGRPHVKKPPNAFMIFRREQSSNVAAELNIKYAVAVNTALGERWNSLSKEQRDVYYRKADYEELLHTLRYPDWSYSDNYGKMKKGVRRKAPATAGASDPEVTQEAKRTCRTAVETALMEASSSLVLPALPFFTSVRPSLSPWSGFATIPPLREGDTFI